MTPLFVGICGGTGSGKTTLAARLRDALGESARLISMDSYYKTFPELTFEQRSRLNFDHPSIIDTELMQAHLTALREGRAVDVPVYDFTTHLRRAETLRTEPAPVIIVEGILLFADARTVELLDMKIYVDTDADVRFIRRMRRDVDERARSLESIVTQYESTVKPMHDAYVEPSKCHADVIIPRGGQNEVAFEMLLGAVRRRMNAGEGERST